MKCLDDHSQIKRVLSQTDMKAILLPDEWEEWCLLSGKSIEEKMKRICTQPLGDEDYTVVCTAYFRLKWVNAFHQCLGRKNVSVLEAGSGSSVNIPNALAVYSPDSKYITANMNEKLTEEFRKKTAATPIEIKVIEDDAGNIASHLPLGSVDAVVFEHSVNDILQAILCSKNGIDTIHNDWFDILPQMIQMISTEYADKTLEASVKGSFLSLLENCLSVLKPGGYLIMSHYMFQYDLDLGYDLELWENMIPIVRPWLRELSVGKEVDIQLFDKQWWLFYQK